MTVDAGSFMFLCGQSGCGKSTLLRHLKTTLSPAGDRTGEILFNGQPLSAVPRQAQAQRIGFVGQSPDGQIVTDTVWHELAFGLENLGYSQKEIRNRTAEMAAFFGIESWFHQNVSLLSGGQKQLLNLASVMTLHPDILILDEPTSQLDPIAASEFLTALKKINTELGITVLLSEHRLEETLPLCSNGAVMENGRILCKGTPEEIGNFLKETGHPMLLSMPTPMRIWSSVPSEIPCPLTAAQGKKWLHEYADTHPLRSPIPRPIPPCSQDEALRLSEVWFRYERDSRDILRGLDLTVHQGEFLAILGGNGAGKTTALRLISGLRSPLRGEISINGRTAMLAQDPRTLFIKKTLGEDLRDMLLGTDLPEEQRQQKIADVTALCCLNTLLDRHPYDLSGGEQQRGALAKLLLLEADILLLDEPTKGLDADFKQLFGSILHSLLERGVTIIMVSHDIEFCAEYAHRCAMFFDGRIVSDGSPQTFFTRNSFYTTCASRMARDVISAAVTADDVISSCTGALPEKRFPSPKVMPDADAVHTLPQADKLPLHRKILAVLSGAGALGICLYTSAAADPSQSIYQTLDRDLLWLHGILAAALLLCAWSLSRRSEIPAARRRVSGKTIAVCLLPLLMVPPTLYIGVCYGNIRQYYLLTLLVMLECMLPFFIAFERKRPSARKLVLIASLCALGAAGRAAFFMLPQFKPIAALTILAGIALGGETGFLVGAVTMLASDMLFAQGPWTPFQMFAMGLIGFLAGILFQKGGIARTKTAICIFGALSVLLIYGGIMNPAAAIIWGNETLNIHILLLYYAAGLPMDLIHAAATVIFLWLGAVPMLEKLERIVTKYGLTDSP